MPRRRRSAGGGGGGGQRQELAALSDDEALCCARPEQRHAANARERARMRVLARAFCRLKTTLPWVPADTKLSKLDTLRLAASYIAHLRAILTDEPAPASARHPLNLTWPFSFQHQAVAGAATTTPQEPPPKPQPCADAGGWPLGAVPAPCRPQPLGAPPSPVSSCSADGDGELEDDDCPLFQRQQQLLQHHHHNHHNQHHHHQSQLLLHPGHLSYSGSIMHLG